MSPTSSPLPVTVVVPTIGRPELLRSCLESLMRCSPPAAELLVVDQGEGPEIAAVVESFAEAGCRYERCEPRGLAMARNVGLRMAVHDVVLQTDDDCTVASDWVEVAWRHMQEEPRGIVTGRVLPVGDPERVPSTITDTQAKAYTVDHFSVLYPNNMVGSRSEMLAIGGFDERMRIAASDNEFCYRWLRDGRRMRFEPDLVVWHHDWRTKTELEQLYVRYAVGQGMVYAKFLWRGDRRIARHLVRDAYWGLRGLGARVRHGRQAMPDYRWAIPRGLPRGLLVGLWIFRPRASSR
jgi:GT2 family glycosyltransferase